MKIQIPTCLLLLLTTTAYAQISFFNMPNPDMLQDVGHAYVEYDRYQSMKGEGSVNASVLRGSVQATKFLELGANGWFNSDNPADPNRIVLATKWKLNLMHKGNLTLTVSPGSWTSVYFNKTPTKNILYNFVGLNHEEGPKTYTRVMFGGYGKFQDGRQQYGMIAGVEHRFNDYIEFVADYFQGSGEGFGLATGIVFYAMDKGHNMPIYFAYQFDNDTRRNDLVLMQVGYFFMAWKRTKR
jgi:hypothetical protein